MSKKVIPKEQLTAYQRWELPAMLEQGAWSGPVEEVAADKGLPTAQEIEALFQRAHAEGLETGRRAGHAEGYAAGFQQGLAAGTGEAANRMQLLDNLLTGLREPLARLDARVEQELLALALEIARQVIRHELDRDPTHLVPVVREAMGALPVNASQPRIVLHPRDAATLRELMPELESQGVQLVEDASQAPGGCRVLADGPEAAMPERRWQARHASRGESEVDARVESRWRDVVVALLGEELIT